MKYSNDNIDIEIDECTIYLDSYYRSVADIDFIIDTFTMIRQEKIYKEKYETNTNQEEEK